MRIAWNPVVHNGAQIAPSVRMRGSNEGVASAGRFLTIDDVAAELNISHAQCYALLRREPCRACRSFSARSEASATR